MNLDDIRVFIPTPEEYEQYYSHKKGLPPEWTFWLDVRKSDPEKIAYVSYDSDTSVISCLEGGNVCAFMPAIEIYSPDCEFIKDLGWSTLSQYPGTIFTIPNFKQESFGASSVKERLYDFKKGKFNLDSYSQGLSWGRAALQSEEIKSEYIFRVEQSGGGFEKANLVLRVLNGVHEGDMYNKEDLGLADRVCELFKKELLTAAKIYSLNRSAHENRWGKYMESVKEEASKINREVSQARNRSFTGNVPR